jgi:hypothetical protein
MTPKEKAEELVDEYRLVLIKSNTDAGEEILCTLLAKECALVAVDEILDFMDRFDLDFEMKHQHKWWKEVKEEIEKL